MAPANNNLPHKELEYNGTNFLRQRLVLSCLSGKSVRISNIRSKDENPGVREYEMSLIRLFDQLCNGTKIQVQKTGTSFLFIPGVLLGGDITHHCDLSRGIGYYLEPVMMLAPFCKRPLNITLHGITNCEDDVSVDQLRYSTLETIRKFLLTDDGLKLIISRRGLPPTGGGVVNFACPVRKQLNPFQWLDSGNVKKVRGMCYTRRVAPVNGNRIIEQVKKVLHNYLTDVYFVVDSAKGPSPGFGIALNCVTTKSSYYSSEALCCQNMKPDTPELSTAYGDSTTNTVTSRSVTNVAQVKSPESVGQEAAFKLLEQICRGGCVDRYSQCLVLLFMVLGPKDVSKIVLGPLSDQAKEMLRNLRDFFSVTFKIEEYRPESLSDGDSDDSDDNEGGERPGRQSGAGKLLLTCVGTGFVNFNKGNL